MMGTRIDAVNGYLRLRDGDYGKTAEGTWYGKPPFFKSGYANLSNHKITEHLDGSITVEPSILVKNHLNEWHGYLTKGVWRKI